MVNTPHSDISTGTLFGTALDDQKGSYQYMMEESEKETLLHKKEELEKELAIQRQIAFATGLFQKDITIRTLLESLGQGVVVIDNNGYILYVNVRAEQMFGFTSIEIIGKHHNIIVPVKLQEIHDKHMENYFKEPKIRPMGQGLNLMGVRRDGLEFPIEISLSYVQIQNSLLVLALVSDITIRVEAEKALKQRAVELEIANNALESFSYSVSHDLRNPLNVIVNLGKILIEEYAGCLDDEGKMYLERIVSNGTRMAELISDMLGLALVSRQDISLNSIDLAPVVKSIIDDLRMEDPNRNVEVIIHKNLEAKGDEKLIRIALSNLLGNAWKYTGKVENPLIEVGVEFREHHKTFFIRDNGVGFDMKYASKLFSPFQRLHPEKEFSGTGVGLAITARVIARHHGRIWAESSPGKGAIFFFELD